VTEQLLAKCTERVAYGYIDPRALFGGGEAVHSESKRDPFYGFWRLKNMAAVCCGLTGPTASIDKKGE